MNQFHPNNLPPGGHAFPPGGPSHGQHPSPEGHHQHGSSLHLQELIDFKHLGYVLLKHIWTIVLIVIVGMVITGAVVWILPDIYESRAVLQVQQQEKKVLKSEKVSEETPGSTDFVNSVVQSLTSRNILLRVIKANNLAADPHFAPPKMSGMGGETYNDDELVTFMEKKVQVSLRRLTRLIDITVTDRNPKLACILASSIVKEFLKEHFEQSLAVSNTANDYLKDEAAKLKIKLEHSEQELQKYKEANNAVSLEQTQNIIVEKLKEVSSAGTEAKNARLKLESDLEQLKLAVSGGAEAMLRISSVAALPQVASVRDDLLKAQTELSILKERYLPKHPKYVATISKIEELKSALTEATSKAGDILTQQYESLKETESKLNNTLTEQEAKALELNKLSIPYNVLSREVETDRALYEAVISRMKETGVSAGIETSPYQVIEEPMVPTRPSAPKRLKILVLAFIVITGAAAGGVILIDSMSSSINSIDQAETLLALPVLGAIPEQKGKKKKKSKKGGGHREVDDYPLALIQDPASPLSESYRSLRAQITLLGPQDQTQVLLFTSAIPSEGKTFTSINTATVFASQGQKTVIIDGDLRRPSVHYALAGGQELPGLTDYLSGQITLDEAIRETSFPGLFLITAGRRAPNPSELLLNADIPTLLVALKERFERIVLDTAPINAVSDTLYLAGPAKKVLLIIRSESTPSKVVQRAVAQLRKSGAQIVGTVLNGIQHGAGAGYYYYSYQGEYGKNSVYGDTSKG